MKSVPLFLSLHGFWCLNSGPQTCTAKAPSVSVDGDLGSVRPKCTFLPPFSLYWAPFIFTSAVTYSSSAGFFPYTRLALEERDGGGISGIPGGRTGPEAPHLESPEVLRIHIGEGWRLLAEQNTQNWLWVRILAGL